MRKRSVWSPLCAGTVNRRRCNSTRSRCSPRRIRYAHTVFERVSGLEYRLTPEGSETSGEEWQNCLTALDGLEFDVLVVSGGLPVDAYYRVIDIAALKNARVVLDTSGPAQEAAAPELVEAGSAEAAMTVAIVNRWSLHAALDYGVAAGAAAVIAPNDGGCRAVDVERRYAASRATRATFAQWKR